MEGERAPRPTRRELLTRGARAGAVVAAGTSGVAALSALGPGVAPARAANTDADWLATAIEAERLAVIAFRHVIAMPGLAPRPRRILRGLLAHERARIRVLAADLRGLGARVPPPPRTEEQVGATLSAHGMNGSLSSATTLKDGLQLLLDVEALCEGAYYRAVGNLSATGPLIHAAQSLAGAAQTTTALQGLLHPGDVAQAVSAWYVAGVA